MAALRAAPAVSVVTDVTDTARCVQSLDAVKRQCTLEPAAAAAHLADYAAALSVVARSVRAALGFAADAPIPAGASPATDGPAPLPDLLKVLAAVCAATHAIAKQPLPKTPDAARGILRREISLITALLALVNGVPDPAVLRLTAKGAIRARGAAIAADPNACLPLLAWVADTLNAADRDDADAAAAPTSGDIATAFIVIDRLGRADATPPTRGDAGVPASVLLAVADWLTRSKARDALGARGGDDAAVNRLVAGDFVARFGPRIDSLKQERDAEDAASREASPQQMGPRGQQPPPTHAAVPPLRAPVASGASAGPSASPTPRTARGLRVATPRLGTFGVADARAGVFEDTIDAANLTRQLLDGHGWCEGDALCVEDATHVLAAAKEAMEDAAFEASQALAHEAQRRRAVEAEIARLFADIADCEAASSASTATSSGAHADLQRRIAQFSSRLQNTSAATPRMSNAFGGFTPRPGASPQQQQPDTERSSQRRQHRTTVAPLAGTEAACEPAEPTD